jgi:hypothetical protein
VHFSPGFVRDFSVFSPSFLRLFSVFSPSFLRLFSVFCCLFSAYSWLFPSSSFRVAYLKGKFLYLSKSGLPEGVVGPHLLRGHVAVLETCQLPSENCCGSGSTLEFFNQFFVKTPAKRNVMGADENFAATEAGHLLHVDSEGTMDLSQVIGS